MNFDLVLRLETKIDQLLRRKSELEKECRSLQVERDALLEERQRFCADLDKILTKLGRLDQETP